MPEDQSEIASDAPEEHSVAEAADAITQLLKKQPEAEDEEGDDAPAPPDAPDGGEKASANGAKPDQIQLDAMKTEAARVAQEAERTRQHLAGVLQQLVPQLETAIRGEFSDIRSEADLARIARDDPARYNRFIAYQGQHAQASAARAQLARQDREAAQARAAAWHHGETAKVGSLVPDLNDPEKGPALANRILSFAVKAGYTPQQMALASANDIVMLHRAMQYEGLEAAQEIARAKAAKAPRVSEPGGRGGKSDRLQSDFERLKKSGRTQDAAAVFRNFID